MRRHLVAPIAPLLLFALQSSTSAFAASTIEAPRLMRDMAVLVIDGHQQLLRVGERSGEVELLAADPQRAVLRVGDELVEIGLTDRIGADFVVPEKRAVRINRDGQGHFRVAGMIEGQPVSFLIDTGATVLAMSSRQAQQLGIDYLSVDNRSQVVTAGGPADSYYVDLNAVDVGGIRVRGVRAAIVEGHYPLEILLGMSFLRHVGLSEQAGVLTLTQDF